MEMVVSVWEGEEEPGIILVKIINDWLLLTISQMKRLPFIKM